MGYDKKDKKKEEDGDEYTFGLDREDGAEDNEARLVGSNRKKRGSSGKRESDDVRAILSGGKNRSRSKRQD